MQLRTQIRKHAKVDRIISEIGSVKTDLADVRQDIKELNKWKVKVAGVAALLRYGAGGEHCRFDTARYFRGRALAVRRRRIGA